VRTVRKGSAVSLEEICPRGTLSEIVWVGESQVMTQGEIYLPRKIFLREKVRQGIRRHPDVRSGYGESALSAQS